jgi:hypothetical protein
MTTSSDIPVMEGSVSLAALAESRGSALRFRIAACIDAADIVASATELPKDFVRSIVCLDLLGATRVPPRASIAKAVGIDRKLLRAYEHAAELIDPELRFEIIRTAVRVIRATQIGGSNAR